MPTLTYEIQVRCLNCKHHQQITVRRGCRWVNASDAQIGSGYYKNNEWRDLTVSSVQRRKSRWVNASDAQIGSGYYKNNDPTKKVKKVCEHCGCDALKWQGNVLKEERVEL